jgi:hypothetical protein
MITYIRTGVLLALILYLTTISWPAIADPAKAVTLPKVSIEETAKKSLHTMSEYLKASKSFSFHADIQYDDVLPSGQKIAFSAESEISLRRPNGLQASQVSDTGTRQLWFNGKQLILLDPVRNTFAVEPVSGNTDQALDHMINQLHFTPPLSDFLYEDPAKALGKNAVHGFVVGSSEVNGVPCQHLAFVDKLIDWQLWIETGKIPLPRKLIITYKTLPSSPQFVATLSNWDFSTRLPDSLFQANIPANAIKLPFMKEGQAKTPSVASVQKK